MDAVDPSGFKLCNKKPLGFDHPGRGSPGLPSSAGETRNLDRVPDRILLTSRFRPKTGAFFCSTCWEVIPWTSVLSKTVNLNDTILLEAETSRFVVQALRPQCNREVCTRPCRRIQRKQWWTLNAQFKIGSNY